MTDLMELASRVEAAEGPDRELDNDIARWLMRDLNWHSSDCLGRYTASIDDAMTLVPEGWAIDKISMWPASPEGASNATEPQSSVSMVGTSLGRYGRRIIWGHSGKDGRVEATSSTPARALTAACLRARAHQGTAHVEQ